MKTVDFILSFAIEIAYMVPTLICEPIAMLSSQHVFYTFT